MVAVEPYAPGQCPHAIVHQRQANEFLEIVAPDWRLHRNCNTQKCICNGESTTTSITRESHCDDDKEIGAHDDNDGGGDGSWKEYQCTEVGIATMNTLTSDSAQINKHPSLCKEYTTVKHWQVQGGDISGKALLQGCKFTCAKRYVFACNLCNVFVRLR